MTIASGRACMHALGAALVALSLGACASKPAVRADDQNFTAVMPAKTEAASPVATPDRGRNHGEAFTSRDLGFELDKPAGDSWAVATNVTSPEGRPIPVVVAHPESGAQIVVQVSEPVDSPEKLSNMLRDKLQAEKSLDITESKKLKMDSGGEGYGFDFHVKGEANGRVAIINVGEHIVLVVASWPEDADKHIVDDIDGVVRSVRQTTGATSPAMLRPDKA